jgi:hypothetical protein
VTDRDRAPVAPRDPRGIKDIGWLLLTIVFGLLFALQATILVILLVTRELARAATVAVLLLGLYWFATGSWRRTSWGDHVEVPAPPGPPVLSEIRAKQLIVAAAACATALATAVTAQILLAR